MDFNVILMSKTVNFKSYTDTSIISRKRKIELNSFNISKIKYCTFQGLQWLIKDFPEWVRNLKGGDANLLFWLQNCMKTRKIRPAVGSGLCSSASLDPPMV